jgi:hypothetical protein
VIDHVCLHPGGWGGVGEPSACCLWFGGVGRLKHREKTSQRAINQLRDYSKYDQKVDWGSIDTKVSADFYWIPLRTEEGYWYA